MMLETLAGFARVLTGSFGISDVLHDLAERVTAVLGLAGAGISLCQEGELRFATAPVEPIAALERVQELHQRGPCIEAVEQRRTIAVPDLQDALVADRWPAYVVQAQVSGVRAVAAVPMLANDEAIGAIDLYDGSQRDWNDTDLQNARVLADIATSYLVHASELERQRRTTEQLREALESRIVIEQAKGIIAASNGISVDEAFKRLQKHSRDRNALIHDVASAVVKLGLRV